ncbi:MAG TPA: DUF2892 domain-containing protein [Williamwhitmania sp.]|nr:DUF2892 domain-containing protein [Williamwhitmania sp.]
MKKNVGSADKIIRIVIGVAIAAAGIYYQSWWGLVAIIPLATAFMGSCGLYSLVGISTCKTKKA